MKVVILCGGQGTRLREETEYKPKPLVTIGGMPILWHIMKTYSFYGHKDFILCLGYKGEMIKEYFLNFENLINDFTLRLRAKKRRIKYHDEVELEDWNITFVNTGASTQTGGRLARVKDFIGSDQSFCLTYGDGVAQININDSIKFHKKHGKVATITGVRPPSRFGELVTKNSQVIEFNEKPATAEGFINGGFFVFNREIFSFLSTDENCILEKAPLESLVKNGEMGMYSKVNFWHCMDTYRDFQTLNEMWDKGQAQWKVWK